MLGYTIVCPDNNTSCEDNLAIQNMLQSEKFNFSMYWSQNPNNQTTGQVISFFQDWLSSDDLYLLVMSSNTTNSTQYTTMRLSAS